jgi:type I restriction enzyme, S subunit
MSEWKEVEIQEIGTVVGGSTPSTKNSDFYDGNISWITPKDLSLLTERFISHGERNITAVGLKKSSAQLIPEHSVLFSSRAPIGYIAIAKNEVCTNQGFKSVVPKKDTYFMFLYYLLKFNKDKIETMGSGTTFKEVSGSTMKMIKVRIPDFKTQKKIADVLSAFDDKIELNNHINGNLAA